MSCYHPIDVYRPLQPNDNGKYPVVFKQPQKGDYSELSIACGQCIGCRLDRSRQWSIRIMNEAKLYQDNCFITLTYDDENLPNDQGLVTEHWQLFMKRLRQHHRRWENKQYEHYVKECEKHQKPPKPIKREKLRFYMCGEYGTDQDPTSLETIGRPHYHAIIFNYDFPDKEQFSEKDGIKLFGSKQLDEIWGKGFCSIGDVTYDSAAYVARYIMKKITGEQAEDHYKRTDYQTGELTYIKPEFTLMSKHPAVGNDWYEKYKLDMHKGFVTVKGNKMAAPKYYQKLYKEEFPFHAETQEFQQYQRSLDTLYDQTPERLAVREKVKKMKLKLLKREL
ncbi:replication initiator protein [Microviridae sp.]|nr:replication initiator protein [Microviridae sp.]